MTQPIIYQLSDLKIISDYTLPYAYKVPNLCEPDVAIRALHNQPVECKELLNTHDEGAFFLYSYIKQKAYYSYKDQGFFEVSGGDCIQYYLYDGYGSDFIVQILLCQCFGAILAQRGMIGIHSGVCYLNKKSVILCGDSGAGKTTLIAELIHRGAEFMADDTACVSVDEGEVYVHALVPLRKLCEDVLLRYPISQDRHVKLPQETKLKIGIKEDDNFHINAEPVGAMFWIHVEPVKNVMVREVRGAEKLGIIINNLYATGAYKELLKTKGFIDKLVTFCNKVPIYELIRPRSGLTIDEMADAIEQAIQENE